MKISRPINLSRTPSVHSRYTAVLAPAFPYKMKSQRNRRHRCNNINAYAKPRQRFNLGLVEDALGWIRFAGIVVNQKQHAHAAIPLAAPPSGSRAELRLPPFDCADSGGLLSRWRRRG